MLDQLTDLSDTSFSTFMLNPLSHPSQVSKSINSLALYNFLLLLFVLPVNFFASFFHDRAQLKMSPHQKESYSTCHHDMSLWHSAEMFLEQTHPCILTLVCNLREKKNFDLAYIDLD